MAVDAAQFQWYKFCNSLNDPQTQSARLSLIDVFHLIERRLRGNDPDKLFAASPEKSRALLFRLNDVLAECRIFSHRYYQPFLAKNVFRFNPLAKSLFLQRRWKKLKMIIEEIQIEIESIPSRIMSAADLNLMLELETGTAAADVRFDEMVAEAEDVLLGRKVEFSGGRRFNACGITGMAGSGKTALARKVFSSPEIVREFGVRIWASLSDPAGSEAGEVGVGITKYLLERVNYDADDELKGTDDGDHDVLQLLAELKRRLSRAGRHLIVFDDVWQESQYYGGIVSCLTGAAIATGRQDDLVKRVVGEHNFIAFLDGENGVSEDAGNEEGIFINKIASKIENVLLGRGGEDFVTYGVVGMSGTGKTTLARQVFNNPRIRQEFPLRVWVRMSDLNAENSYTRTKTVKYMLEQLHYDADQEMRGTDTNDIDALLVALKKILCKKKYLIVLDGVWEENAWCQDLSGITRYPNKLSYALPKAPDGAEGGAVLVTGRVEEHVKRMVGQQGRVTHMNNDDQALQDKCWKIFEINMNDNMAGLSENMKNDTWYKIQGLPLAANTLARIISSISR